MWALVVCLCLGCRRSPRASAWSERAVRGPPDFFVHPSHILFARKEGLFAEPLSACLGRWVSAWLQEEPPSLCMEREGGQEFPWLFVRPSRILFVWKEGLFAEPSGESLGHWVSARLQEGFPSLYTEREGD